MERTDEDAERFAIVASRLHTPVIGGILDQLGLHHQFPSPRLRPLQPTLQMVGQAMPLLLGDTRASEKVVAEFHTRSAEVGGKSSSEAYLRGVL